MNSIKSIVLSGGPCSGKSKGIDFLKQYLVDLGYKVVVIPELATEIRQNGLIHTEGVITNVDFQRAIFQLQLFKENLYKDIMSKYEDPSRMILLLDRGLLDAKIFLDKCDFEKLIMEYGLTEEDILNRYDAVFHMQSTAIMGDNYYNNISNQFRLSNLESAIIQEEKSIEVWKAHHNFQIIGFEINFDDKVKKLKKSVLNEIKR